MGVWGQNIRGPRRDSPQELRQSGEAVHFPEARARARARAEDALRRTGPAGGLGLGGTQGALLLPALTLLAQQEGVEAQVVDGQVEPALPRHAALPVAAGVVVDQLLSLGHPKLLPHFQLGLLELPRVLISLGLQVLVLFCDDAL